MSDRKLHHIKFIQGYFGVCSRSGNIFVNEIENVTCGHCLNRLIIKSHKMENHITHESLVNIWIKSLPVNTNFISDGYHTFGELYEHRIELFIALCKMYDQLESIRMKGTTWWPSVWKSRVHSDGSVMDGWFILGINKIKGNQITYHLPDSKWNDCSFAMELEKAPDWDGHTSADVLERLKNL